MPYLSESQRRWAHTEAGKEALGGEAAVHEWDEAAKGKKLPEKVEKGELKKFGGMMQLGLNEKTPKTVKTPRQRSMPGPDAKPSVFFKSDEKSIKHPSTRKLYDFMAKCALKKSSDSNLMKSEAKNMSEEKKYTPYEVALAVLAKAQELLEKTTLAKSEEPAQKVAEHQSGMHTVAYYSNKPFEKSESLDFGFEPFQELEKAEGSKIKGVHESIFERDDGTSKMGFDTKFTHRRDSNKPYSEMSARKEARRVLSETRSMPKPNLPKSEVIKAENPDKDADAKLGEDVEGLCERHMLENIDAERKEGHQIVKSEMCKMCKSGMQKSEEDASHNEIGTKFEKKEGQGAGNKEEPSDSMKPRIKEEQAPQRDAQDFETKPGHAPENDHREEEQAAPESNPHEQKEGNNPEAGSVPGKGVHKLAFFMGHRHHKKNMKKGIAIG